MFPLTRSAAAVALAAVAACTPAHPHAATTTRHGAPRVRHPMAADVRGRPPCTLLPDSRLTAAGVPADADHRAVSDVAADACLWGDPGLSGADSLAVAWSHRTPSLDALYADRAGQVYFIPATVLGYPAAYANTVARQNGHCVLTVAVTDTTAFYTAMQLTHPTRNQACIIAGKAAAEVIRTLRDAQGPS